MVLTTWRSRASAGWVSGGWLPPGAMKCAGLLVATKRDRFARDVILAAQLERLVERDGAELVSADGASEGNSPEATMMRRILDIFGAFERDLIRARTRAALAVKRAKGLKFGSTAPYGYRINGDRLEPEVGERQAVIRSVALAKSGCSLRRIAMALTAEGFKLKAAEVARVGGESA